MPINVAYVEGHHKSFHTDWSIPQKDRYNRHENLSIWHNSVTDSLVLTLLHSERPKLYYTVLAFLSAIGLTKTKSKYQMLLSQINPF